MKIGRPKVSKDGKGHKILRTRLPDDVHNWLAAKPTAYLRQLLETTMILEGDRDMPIMETQEQSQMFLQNHTVAGLKSAVRHALEGTSPPDTEEARQLAKTVNYYLECVSGRLIGRCFSLEEGETVESWWEPGMFFTLKENVRRRYVVHHRPLDFRDHKSFEQKVVDMICQGCC